MRRVFVSNSQPIRFARFDNKSVNRGLPVLDQTRALDPCHRPEGSWALGTRMPEFQSGKSYYAAFCASSGALLAGSGHNASESCNGLQWLEAGWKHQRTVIRYAVIVKDVARLISFILPGQE